MGNEGGKGLFGDPMTAAKSRKKWIALGLCSCLILVLLIAVIVLATSKKTPPPCPLATNNSDAAVGSNEHLKSNENLDPSVGESRMEGINEGTSEQPRKVTEFAQPLGVEVDIEVDIVVVTDKPSVEASPSDRALDRTSEQPFEVTNFKQPRGNGREAGGNPVNSSDVAKLKQFNETLTKEEEVNKVIEKYEPSVETSNKVLDETSEQPFEDSLGDRNFIQPRKNLDETSEDDVSVKVSNLTEKKTSTISELDQSFDGIYDDDFSDLDFKSGQDNALHVFHKNESNEEHESLAPKYIPTPDDEFSREDV